MECIASFHKKDYKRRMGVHRREDGKLGFALSVIVTYLGVLCWVQQWAQNGNSKGVAPGLRHTRTRRQGHFPLFSTVL